MAKESKNMKERLFEIGEAIKSPPSSVDELYSLLDATDGLLSRVEQSPSQLMLDALDPLMKALAAKDFLRHSDMDVKVSVASCYSEITRITAPDAPYDDDIMKEIFQMIVGAFEGLDDTSSRSYQKRVSILETVAKVRSCVIMLDLECDALILQMFHHFLKAIRADHSENVFSSMETIMTLVIEESEDISAELLSCLLHAVKKDNKDVLPIASTLAEKVMNCCASKIKPYLMELVQSTGASLSEYSKVVASICQENSDGLDHKEMPVSGEADDSKLSTRTVSDELPQVSAKAEQEVGCLEKVATAADTSPPAATSNGNVQMGNGDSMDQLSFPKQKPKRSRCSGQSESVAPNQGQSESVATDQADCGNPKSTAVTQDGKLGIKKGKGRKTNSQTNSRVQLNDAVDRIDSDKDAQVVTSRRKGRTKKADGSEVGDAPAKVEEHAVPLGPEKNELHHLLGSDNATSDTSPAPIESPPNSSRTKRGRPPGPKAVAKRSDVAPVADPPALASPQKDPLEDNQVHEVVMPSGSAFEKELEDVEAPRGLTSGLDVKPTKHAGKKGRYKRGKVVEQETSEKRQKSNMKQKKEEGTHGEDVDGELTLKEMASSPRYASKAPNADETHLDDRVKPRSRKKRILETEEMTHVCKKELDECVVGSKIKVWWPDDQMFYEGVVASYNRETMEHTVAYTDGDVEVLLLKNERWEYAESDLEKDGGKERVEGSGSHMPRAKKAKAGSTLKTSSNTTSKQVKPQQQSKSGAEPQQQSSSKEVPRPRGRPRGGTSNLGKLSYDDSPGTSKKSKDKPASNDKVKTPRSRERLKDRPENEPEEEAPMSSSKQEEPRNKSMDVTSKSGTAAKGDTSNISGKSKDGPSKSSRKSKNDPPKAGAWLKDDTSKGVSKLGDDSDKSKDSPPKTAIISEADDVGKNNTRNSKPKTKSFSKTGGDSKPNGIPSKGNAKVGDGENTATASAGEATTTGGTGGRKRKRKGRK